MSSLAWQQQAAELELLWHKRWLIGRKRASDKLLNFIIAEVIRHHETIAAGPPPSSDS